MKSNEVTVNLDMFSALVKNIIVSNLNGTLIVTMDGRTAKQRDTYIGKKPVQPKKFGSSVSKCTIFNFNARSNNRLFLTPP
jgi:hypothetical protein